MVFPPPSNVVLHFPEQIYGHIDDKVRFPSMRIGETVFLLSIVFIPISFAAFGGILFGYDTGVISGVKEMKDWLRTFGFPTTDLAHYPYGYAISSSTESLVVSILSAGTFFGALIAAPTAGTNSHQFNEYISDIRPDFLDIIGRKWVSRSCYRHRSNLI